MNKYKVKLGIVWRNWNSDVDAHLLHDPVHLQLRVLADDLGPEIAGHVVPLDSILVPEIEFS